ncbi:MAG: MFS transporter [Alphaproteobacteria bacterium]
MRKIIISGMIGNTLEWYDFALYGHFATIISKLYFPTDNPSLSLIAAFSVFAAGFLMRPIGGVLFGYIGDKFGRKASLILSILLMAIPTACIGILPTYDQIGIFAPLLLTLIRLLQGLSLGGGFSGCIAFTIEHAPENRRGFAGSASVFSMCAGILLGLGVATLFSHILPIEKYESWGWRVPFIISIFIGLIGLYMKNLNESPEYIKAKNEGTLSKTPLREVTKFYLPELMVAIGIYFTVTVPFYTLMIFMNSFMSKIIGQPIRDALLMNSISIVILMCILPYASSLSDRIGRKPVLIFSSVAFILMTYPIFQLLMTNGFIAPLLGQILFATILAFYIAPVPAILVELFPTSVRFTGVALSYNISAAVFGGTTPAVAIWLIENTEREDALAFYIILFASLSLASLYFYKDRFNEPLRAK